MDTANTPSEGDDAGQDESQDGTSQQDEAGQRDEESQADRGKECIRLARLLSPRQRIALQALSDGCSIPEAARRAKAHPSTVNRWLNYNARFIAAHHAWIEDTIKVGRAASVALIPLAASAVRDAIEMGNGWIALQVLRDANLTTPTEAGPTTPKAARQEMKLARQNRDNELLKKEAQIKLQQQEIEKLQAQVKEYEDKKKFEEEQNKDYFVAWAEFWGERDDEKRWQEQNTRLRKERLEREMKPHQQSIRQEALREHLTRKPETVQSVWGESAKWKRRHEQQRREEEQDQELLKALKANPDGVAPRSSQNPPGTQAATSKSDVTAPDVPAPDGIADDVDAEDELDSAEGARQPEVHEQSADSKVNPDSGRSSSGQSNSAAPAGNAPRTGSS
jgi:hypothetical protein